MKRCAAAIVGMAILVAAPSALRAQDSDTLARTLFQRGDTAYAEGRYEAALALFQEAYEISHRPALLYNLANTLERLGRASEAVARLHEFLPNAPENLHDIVEHRIAALEEREAHRVQEEQARHAAETSSTPPPETLASPSPAPLTSVAPGPAPVVRDRPRPSWIGPVVLAGTALVAGGLSIGFGLATNGADSAVRAGCRTVNSAGTLCDESVRGDISNAQSFGYATDISWVVSALALTGGVTWTIVQVATTHRERPPVAFFVLPGGVGIAGQL